VARPSESVPLSRHTPPTQAWQPVVVLSITRAFGVATEKPQDRSA
jgi:hypothetical protein